MQRTNLNWVSKKLGEDQIAVGKNITSIIFVRELMKSA
jgi:hypothetical protein